MKIEVHNHRGFLGHVRPFGWARDLEMVMVLTCTVVTLIRDRHRHTKVL